MKNGLIMFFVGLSPENGPDDSKGRKRKTWIGTKSQSEANVLLEHRGMDKV
jgi:hypothetical protein